MRHQQLDFARAFILLFAVPLNSGRCEAPTVLVHFKGKENVCSTLPNQSLRHCLLISLERTETEKSLFVLLRKRLNIKIKEYHIHHEGPRPLTII
jgi:hypothetical protein